MGLLVHLFLSILQVGLLAILAFLYDPAIRSQVKKEAERLLTITFRDLLLVFFLTIAISLLISIGEPFVIGPLPIRNPEFVSVFYRFTLRNAPILCLGVFFYLCVLRRRSVPVSDIYLRSSLPLKKQVWVGFQVGVAFFVLRGLAFFLLPNRLEFWRLDPFIWWSLSAGFPFLTLADIAFIVFLVPIVEEGINRGCIYPLLRAYLRIAHALPLSLLLWILIHPESNVTGFAGLAILGTVLTLLYEQTKSVCACTIVHFMVNLSSILMMAASLVLNL